MQFFPDSGTLSEAGAAGAVGGGGGMASPMGGGMAAMANAGEILLNRAESAALAALETEDDTDYGMRRAQAESGLDRQQLLKLQRRVATASSKGYTLKGTNFVKRPLSSTPDEPGLARKAMKGDAEELGLNTEQKLATKQKQAAKAAEEEKAIAKAKQRKPAEPTAKAAKTKETNTAVYTRDEKVGDLYVVKGDYYGFPTPHSNGLNEACDDDHRETNSRTTMAAMMERKRRKQKKSSHWGY